jgi:hypothetical protein
MADLADLVRLHRFELVGVLSASGLTAPSVSTYVDVDDEAGVLGAFDIAGAHLQCDRSRVALAPCGSSVRASGLLLSMDRDGEVQCDPLTVVDVFVDMNGTDTLADGTLEKPFLTIRAAIDSIKTASRTRQFRIFVLTGVHTMEHTITLADHVFVVGAQVRR